MYIDPLILDNIRTFYGSKLDFVHPESRFRSSKKAAGEPKRLLPRPRLPNVNLLLGDNASGKTTILQAIALGSLGPAAQDSRIPFRKLVRLPQEDRDTKATEERDAGDIIAYFAMDDQDRLGSDNLQIMQVVERVGELERIRSSSVPIDELSPIYNSRNASFFCVAYGAFRRVETAEDSERGMRGKEWFPAAKES